MPNVQHRACSQGKRGGNLGLSTRSPHSQGPLCKNWGRIWVFISSLRLALCIISSSWGEAFDSVQSGLLIDAADPGQASSRTRAWPGWGVGVGVRVRVQKEGGGGEGGCRRRRRGEVGGGWCRNQPAPPQRRACARPPARASCGAGLGGGGSRGRRRPPRASTVDGPVVTEGASGVPTLPRCPRGCRPVSAPLPASPPAGR